MEINIRLNPQTRHVYLPISINDEGPFDFTLDTGAVATTVTPKLLKKFRIEIYDEGLIDTKKPNIPVRFAKIPKMTIGSITLENEEVMVTDLRALLKGAAGELHSVLGHTTLKNYVMTLNYRTGVFTPPLTNVKNRENRSALRSY